MLLAFISDSSAESVISSYVQNSPGQFPIQMYPALVRALSEIKNVVTNQKFHRGTGKKLQATI